MAEPVLGVDIAKRKFDVTLLVNDELKHKVFTNNQEGFVELVAWLKKHGVDRTHVCLEASRTYGDELATFLYDAGQSVGIVNSSRIKGFAQSELLRTKNDKVDAGVIACFCTGCTLETPPPTRDQNTPGTGEEGGRPDAHTHPGAQPDRDHHETVTLSMREHLRIWTERLPNSRSRSPNTSSMTHSSEPKGTCSALSRGLVKPPLPPSWPSLPSLSSATGFRRRLSI